MGLTVMTWNVNSIRARLDHVLTYLADHEPDVVCLQETKVDDNLFPRVPFMELGYTIQIHGSKSQAGVATATKAKPTAVHKGFREGKDKHARILEVEVEGVTIYNLYVPNGTSLGSDAYEYKLQWLRRLGKQLKDVHDPSGDVVLVGDFNIALDPRDVYDHDHYVGRLLYTDEEKAALREMLSFGLSDCFRALDDSDGVYSWYDYRTGGFAKGEGLRIDHVYGTPSMVKRCKSVVHDQEPRDWDVPSDHIPVLATFT